MQCERVLGHFQAYLLERSSSAPVPESLHSARLWIASVIAVCALAQLCAGIVLFTFSARANCFRLTSSYWHLFLGLGLLLLALVHSRYCCPLFFAHLLPIAGIYSLLFALLPLPPSGHPLRQFLAIGLVRAIQFHFPIFPEILFKNLIFKLARPLARLYPPWPHSPFSAGPI
jgi:hypothetical protein